MMLRWGALAREDVGLSLAQVADIDLVPRAVNARRSEAVGRAMLKPA